MTMTMMSTKLPIAAFTALLYIYMTAEKLELKLEPALEFHSATGCCGDDAIFFVSLVEPPSTNFCEKPVTIYQENPSSLMETI
jgi:hypothetical protein